MEKRESSKLTLRLGMNIIGAVGALVLLLLAAFSFGWFTALSPVNWRGSTFAASNGVFELASADKSGLYDEYLSAADGAALDGIVFEDGSAASLISTTDGAPEIKWLMSDESNLGNLSGEGIQPGSFGKLTFYVIAKQDGNLDLTFSLNTFLYDSGAEPISALNPDNSEHIIPDTEAAVNLVGGHILFFEHYDELSGVYSDRIIDSFRFTKSAAVEDTAYEVEFYWVWPEFIDQLILPSDDPLLTARGYQRLLEDGSALVTDDAEFFSDAVSGLALMLENVSKGSYHEDFSADSYNLLNQKWNEADQIIGTKVGFIELQLTADLYADEP